MMFLPLSTLCFFVAFLLLRSNNPLQSGFHFPCRRLSILTFFCRHFLAVLPDADAHFSHVFRRF